MSEREDPLYAAHLDEARRRAWHARPEVDPRPVPTRGFLRRELWGSAATSSRPGEECRSEHGAGPPDCPRCWRYSERNPNRVDRP